MAKEIDHDEKLRQAAVALLAAIEEFNRRAILAHRHGFCVPGEEEQRLADLSGKLHALTFPLHEFSRTGNED